MDIMTNTSENIIIGIELGKSVVMLIKASTEILSLSLSFEPHYE